VVNGVRARVDAWRAQEYPGASDTSRRLLSFWFEDDHLDQAGEPFRFYFCQREAVETFIYLAEIARVRAITDLLEYAESGMMVEPGEAKRARLAFKMATGSGKTMAISLCVVWSYFHAVYEPDSPMATSFLVIAPNLIVFERLTGDFGDGITFRRDPLIPPEWIDEFELSVVLQDELSPVTGRGALYLTNVHRLYEDAGEGGRGAHPPNAVEVMVGPRVRRDLDSSGNESLFDAIAERGRVLVANDEAHHVHDPKLEWSKTIERLDDALRKRAPDDDGAGVVCQLDFSATPRYEKGGTFKHVVVDYPLAQAVYDGIVKTPVIGEIKGAEVELGETSFRRNRQWLDVAVERWRKFNEALSPSGHHPVLFVMCENTKAADEAGDYLHQMTEFAGDRLLVIHVNNKTGEITKDYLDRARRAAREVDLPENPIRCIVSVLMLREGWDVRNVCVIVTLRALSAANKILPEQALGRGLRRMTPPGSGFDERVVVIEHEAFRSLWEKELDGGLVVERQAAEKVQVGALTIFPDESKRRYDIAIPQLSRVLTRSDKGLEQLLLADVQDPRRCLEVPDVEPDEYVQYRGRHLIDKGLLEEYEFRIPYAENASAAITYYTRCVAREGGVDGLSGAFTTLYPLVRDYLAERLFERQVKLESKVILRRLAENDAQVLVSDAFAEAIRALSVVEREPEIAGKELLLFDTAPFPWSRQTVEGVHTIFNLAPVENALEERFARFLDRAEDVAAWAKLAQQVRFNLEYISHTGALRYYHPDFLLRLADRSCVIVETKGQVDLDVPLKDRRAERWCSDASNLAGYDWSYTRVNQATFDAYTGADFDGLRRYVAAGVDSTR
jgi:type III restriction enzyme